MTYMRLISGAIMILLLLSSSLGLAENSPPVTGNSSDHPADGPVSSDQAGNSSILPVMETPTRALIVVAPQDYNEEELAGVVSALESDRIEYDIASVASGAVTGMSGGTSEAKLSFDDFISSGIAPYNGIILIGGEGAITNLYDNQALRELVRSFDQQEKTISAICASPVVLSRAGILQGKRITLFGDPDLIEEVRSSGALVSDNPVVTDGRIITGNGPSAAVEFGRTVSLALQ